MTIDRAFFVMDAAGGEKIAAWYAAVDAFERAALDLGRKHFPDCVDVTISRSFGTRGMREITFKRDAEKPVGMRFVREYDSTTDCYVPRCSTKIGKAIEKEIDALNRTAPNLRDLGLTSEVEWWIGGRVCWLGVGQIGGVYVAAVPIVDGKPVEVPAGGRRIPMWAYHYLEENKRLPDGLEAA